MLEETRISPKVAVAEQLQCVNLRRQQQGRLTHWTEDEPAQELMREDPKPC